MLLAFTQPLHVEGTCQLVLLIGQHTLGIHLFGRVLLDNTRVGGAQVLVWDGPRRVWLVPGGDTGGCG
jgi:hypothetical protein